MKNTLIWVAGGVVGGLAAWYLYDRLHGVSAGSPAALPESVPAVSPLPAAIADAVAGGNNTPIPSEKRVPLASLAGGGGGGHHHGGHHHGGRHYRGGGYMPYPVYQPAPVVYYVQSESASAQQKPGLLQKLLTNLGLL